MAHHRSYVYLYFDTRKPGKYCYGGHTFSYEPLYVGKGTHCLVHYKGGSYYTKRWRDHLSLANSQKTGLLYSKIRKIRKVTGRDPLIKILKDGLTPNQACKLEIELIRLIGRLDQRRGPLANHTRGGDGVREPSAESIQKRLASMRPRRVSWLTRERISKALRGRPHAPEHNKAISKALKRKPKAPHIAAANRVRFKGHHHTEESKARISKALKGRALSEQHRNRIGKARKGFRHTEAAKAHLSKLHWGKALFFTKTHLRNIHYASLRRQVWWMRQTLSKLQKSLNRMKERL